MGVDCGPSEVCLPWNNPRYGYLNFDNVLSGFLVIFQVITFEGWTEVLEITFFVWGRGSIIYFFFLIMIGSYFIPNLALAVINDKFNEAQKQQAEADESEAVQAAKLLRMEKTASMKLRGPDADRSQPTVYLSEKPFLSSVAFMSGDAQSVDALDSLALAPLGGSVAIPCGPESVLSSPYQSRNEFSCLTRARDWVHLHTEGYSLFHPANRLRTYEELQAEDEDAMPTPFMKFIIFAIILNTLWSSQILSSQLYSLWK
jgi:uncharacterized membrane protein